MATDALKMCEWTTPSQSQMPLCKICKKQGCSHFRRGFAHLLALNSNSSTSFPSCTNVDSGVQKISDMDIVIPTTCPCHGCSERIERVDVNRGTERSVTYLYDGRKSSWQPTIARYRYKKDTEIVIGCTGRHKIIESPKAGRYAQLWCRTCCNCESSNKPCGKLLGCACAMHWHTVTNRSYHEKTPFHQLATTLIMTAYNDAMGGECKFDESYYKPSSESKAVETAVGRSLAIKSESMSSYDRRDLEGAITRSIPVGGWHEPEESQLLHRHMHLSFPQQQIPAAFLPNQKLLHHAVDASHLYFSGMDAVQPSPLFGTIPRMPPSLPPRLSRPAGAVPEAAHSTSVGRKREERSTEDEADERGGKRTNQVKDGSMDMSKDIYFSLADLPDILTSGGKLSGGLTLLGPSEY